MRTISFRKLAILLAILLTPLVGHTTTIVQQSLQGVTTAAELVFEGTVVGLQVEGSGKQIHTWVTIEVVDVIKGKYDGDLIELRYMGGTVGDVSMKVAEMTMPELGETGIYFVESTTSYQVNPLVGWGQGRFLIKSDSKTGQLSVYNSQGIAVVGLETVPANNAVTISSGTAKGVILADQLDASSSTDAMNIEAFKKQIREWK